MKSLKIRYKIYTLGCKVNQYDSGNLSRRLVSVGFVPVEKGADIAIVNTCAVTKTAISKGKRMINKARHENPSAKIIIMGCWPRVYGDDMKDVEADLAWRKDGKFNELVKKIYDLGFNNYENDKCEKSSPAKYSRSSRSRYFLKIQDGCEQFCSYCIIPYARGKLRSRPEEEILKEAEDAIDGGCREIVLCGIHLGLYGRGLGNSITLSELLGKILRIGRRFRVRLSSIEINEVTDELIDLMARNRKICKHLHIPLQSGSDRILKLMNRPYTTLDFRQRVKKMRKSIPDIAVTTDIIAGFPGETETDFKETHDFVRELAFSRLHVFPFSAHEKTPAAKLPGRVRGEEMRARTKALRKLGAAQAARFKEEFTGKNLEVIVENIEGDKFTGKTEYYFDIVSPKKGRVEKGGLITVKWASP